MDFHKYLAESIATFSLVFIGAGAVAANAAYNNALGIVGIALAHGLVLMSMIYATRHISGAHVNPAVTIAMLVTKKIQIEEGLGYIVFQLLGAAIAGLFLSSIFAGAPASVHLGVTDLAAGVSPNTGILLEAVLTFFLVFVIFAVAVDSRGLADVSGLAIGLVLTFDILVGGSLTGAAMNPARAFGPAIASGYWTTQPVYWIGPVIGAVIAALIYDRIFVKKEVV
ncbi:MAG: aquaporin [Candidatus Aenigmarchaeota archaeon]|nr:aquaporin [Candidatus Aenigmarchaeota archaeon]